MEKNTRTKNILLVVLLVAVLTLSISYATLSQYLYINSQATVAGSSTSWDVKFTAASCQGTGYATVTQQFSGTNTTSLSGMQGTLRAPGDSIVCELTVSNAGAIDATLSTFTLQDGQLTYTDHDGGHDPAQSTDIAAVSGNLVYSLVYASDDAVTAARGLAPDGAGSGTTVDDDIEHGGNRKLTLTITFPSSVTTLPVNDVTVSGFATTFLYIQD